MKHTTLLKSLLVIASQAAFPVYAATISTTTLVDENGEGADCSLREAVYAANTNLPFGGCPAGNALADDSIVLSKGTYLLTKGELKVTQSLKLFGVNTYRDEINPLTGESSTRVRPETIIDAGALSRILSTEGTLDAGLELTDLELRNGRVTGNGGAILSWSSVSLDNVVIKASSALGATTAQGSGGAVYLARSGAGISMSDSMMLGNAAAVTGGAIAMNCEFNGDLALHQVSVTRSALDSNSSTNGAGAVFACGSSTVSLQTSTISRNVSAPASGAIVLVNSGLPAAGGLALRSVTAVQNTAGPVMRVGGVTTLDVSNSVLAFNGGGNCALTVPAAATTWKIDSSSVQDSVASGCQVTGVTWGTGNTEVPAGITLASELAPFSSTIGGLVDGYMPLAASLYVLNKGQVTESCEPEDQRGVSRKSGTACDTGAVERRELTTVDDEGTNRPKKDRMAYVDVLANDTPPESASLTTTVADIWATATVTPIASATSPGTPAPDCDWVVDPDDTEAPIQMMLQINSHGKTGTFACDYTVSITGSPPSTARVEVEIKNSRPVAVADSYVRPVGTTEVFLDLLANDHDDNDGAVEDAGLYVIKDDPDTPFVESTLRAYSIRITQEPALGRIEGLSSIDCPATLVSEPNRKCFAAEGLRYVAYNNLSPFSDSFKYVVYDMDKEESAEAVVTITTDAPDPEKKGGTADWLLLGVLAMAGLRRVRRL